MNHKLSMLLLALCAFATALPSRAASASEELFESKIRPVLAEHCYECHSASSKKLKGGLRVDGREALLSGGDTGPAIVPGKPESSLLVTAMAHRDKELIMPPKKPQLPDAIIADFEKWIRDGAVWPVSQLSSTPAKKEVFNLEARK
ncbi:MAG: hypothetical protein JWM16_4430, partial [Verrucomicrobiales bacterium]|nr:hypothetical protein [Verrucomicrobiales bacterium]